MGAQIGCEYALGGHDVTLVARDTGAVVDRVSRAWALIETERLAAAAAIVEGRSRLDVRGSLDDEAKRCDLAVESLPEVLELKAELLGQVASASPDAVLASNTSSISISVLGDAAGAPDRIIGTHYLNPPLLMPTVEVVPGSHTRQSITALVVETLAGLHKLPIVVDRDVPGFIWNRLQFALLRECTALVDDGVATSDAVDLVIREGLARRWRRVGPFAAIQLGGVDTWMRAAANLVSEISTTSDLGDLGRFSAGDADEIERLGAARDRLLAAEIRAERGIED